VQLTEINVIVQLEGSIAQGSPIDTASAGELVAIPADLMAIGDVVFRASAEIPGLGIRAGDYLIVEPRYHGHVRTGELVIALVRGIAFIGRWWKKKGRRAVMGEEMSALAEGKDVRVFGAITLIVRPE
jgi:SOS-response transcriptional repressor LexA